MKTYILLAVFLATLQHGIGQNIENKGFKAGFKTLSLVDSTRLYKPNTQATDRLHYRPVDLDIWYPAKMQSDTALLFEDLFQLFEQRAVKYQDDEDYSGIMEELAIYFAAGFGVGLENGKQLLEVKTNSYENIKPAAGPFPLIIYMAGFNGMGFENFKLLEKLAESGYIVISVWSFGRYPGSMTTEKGDMLAQVQDAEFALKALDSRPEFDINLKNIGVLGYSWGGLSGVVLADRHPNVNAVVSLDGSEVHYYGESELDGDMNEIFGADLIHPETKSSPYLYMESGDKLEYFTATGVYDYFKKVSAAKYYLRLINGEHEDFSSLPSILEVSDQAVSNHRIIQDTSLSFFNKYLKSLPGFIKKYHGLVADEEVTDQPFEISDEPEDKLVLRGRVLDSKTLASLPYVNIGIVNMDQGTVSSQNGTFELRFDKRNLNDSLRFSTIGYRSKTFLVSHFYEQKQGADINLEEVISELTEVTVTAKALKSKVLGNKTKSKFLSTGFFYDQLGAEMGIKINVRKKPSFLETFNFHVSYNRLSAKALFRLNIYSVKNGKPSENILRQNIIIPVEAKQTGLISTDLSKYDIILRDDIIATLEWVNVEGEMEKGEGVFFSLGLITGGTYVRYSSQSKLKKKRGLGVGFNINVKH